PAGRRDGPPLRARHARGPTLVGHRHGAPGAAVTAPRRHRRRGDRGSRRTVLVPPTRIVGGVPRLRVEGPRAAPSVGTRGPAALRQTVVRHPGWGAAGGAWVAHVA